MSPERFAVSITPALLALMLGEAALARWLGRTVHGRRQTLANVAMAAAQRVVASGTGIAPLLGYPWLQEHLGLFRWSPSSPGQWLLAFLAVDLAIYLRHRAGHRIGVLWAMHAVHHQSRDYNLTVATRLSWLQEGILWALPLAVLGAPIEMVLPLFVFHNLWQFLQHTELVGRLGPLERWLMTPSNHRVHHGSNPEYLDRNYGSVLAVWDRLAGTWTPEVAPVVYGTLDGPWTCDVVDDGALPFALLVAKARRAPTRWQALRCLWMPPEWQPDGAVAAPIAASPPPVPPLPAAAWAVGAGAVAAGLAGALALTWFAADLALAPRLVATGVVLATLALGGVALDGRRVPRVPGVTRQLAVALEVLAGEARGPVWLAARAVRALEP